MPDVKYRCGLPSHYNTDLFDDHLSEVHEEKIEFVDPNLLKPQDLIDFAFQCASGMQYLASKKVINFDLFLLCLIVLF